MPIVPNLVERTMFGLKLAPGIFLDFLGAEAFAACIAAHRLGVFSVLAAGALTGAEVAHRIRADERATLVLLRALDALGYVRNKRGHYRLTPMTAKWMPALGEGIGFFTMLIERFGDLEQAIRLGAPVVDPREWLDRRPHGWRDFQGGMVVLARLAADQIAAKTRLPRSACRLLDVGGGHGLYSIAFCRRSPQLTATVFDLAPALEPARDMVAAANVADRVTLQPGDFWKDELGNGYDVALLFNIVHGILPDKNVELLRKVAVALNPNGLVVILDQLTGRVFGATARAFAALMGLNLFNLAGGQTYAFEEIAGWLTAAGFTNLRCHRLHKLPGNSLVLGTKLVSAGSSLS